MIIFLIRHADRTAGDELSAAGRARAVLLARMLGESGVSIAYRSDAVRAKQTLAPLEATLGESLEVHEVPFDGLHEPDDHIQKIVKAIGELPAGKIVLVIGHTNTIPQIIGSLAQRPAPPIGDTEFDRLFVVVLTTPDATIAQLRFGDPTL